MITGTQLLINLVGGILRLLWGIRSVRLGILRGYGSDIRDLMYDKRAAPGYTAGL